MTEPSKFTIQERVRWGDVDAARIIFYGAYIRFFEFAETELFRAVGMPYGVIFDELDVWLPRVHLECDFRHAAQLDDLLAVSVYVGRVGNKSLRLDFEVRRQGDSQMIATAFFVLAAVDRRTFKTVRVPDTLRERLSPYTVEQEDAQVALDDALDEKTAGTDPLQLFARWFAAARQAGIGLPEAMTVATATKEGRPSARMLLLKRFDEKGFVFYTNYNSNKARDLDSNPYAALVFHWEPLGYQVRIEGSVTRASAADSDAYFQTRPRESQLGAHASPQSTVIANRELLDRRVAELNALYGTEDVIARPEHWGGYVLRPERIEFWKGRVGRLHDRLLYERSSDGGWTIKRLAP
jgi:pyridoxamine 5'-phosphate oxidase